MRRSRRSNLRSWPPSPSLASPPLKRVVRLVEASGRPKATLKKYRGSLTEFAESPATSPGFDGGWRQSAPSAPSRDRCTPSRRSSRGKPPRIKRPPVTRPPRAQRLRGREAAWDQPVDAREVGAGDTRLVLREGAHDWRVLPGSGRRLANAAFSELPERELADPDRSGCRGEDPPQTSRAWPVPRAEAAEDVTQGEANRGTMRAVGSSAGGCHQADSPARVPVLGG